MINWKGVINIVKVKEDLTGRKFGKLTVLEQAEDYVISSGGHYAKWKCKCDCGNVFITRQYSITSGKTKSCGCLHKENISKLGKSNRKYENKCTECGTGKHYAKGLCRNCYSKMRRKEFKQCQEEK